MPSSTFAFARRVKKSPDYRLLKKFFEFLKDLACTCEKMEGTDNPLSYKFRTTLDLCHFPSISQFSEKQVGDGPMITESET